MGELWSLEGGGTLRVREEESWIYLEVVRPEDGKGLYKVWCLGESGEFLLGTLVPQGNRLYLERRVTKRTLQEAGAWPLTGGKVVMVYSFTGKTAVQEVWHPEAHPEEFCCDPVVRACLQFSLTRCSASHRSWSSRGGGIWCGALIKRAGLSCRSSEFQSYGKK